MKKRVHLLLIPSLLASSFLCGSCDMFNPPVEVTFIDENNEVVQTSKIRMTKAANVPELNYTRIGYSFRGWTLDPNAVSPKIKPGKTLKYMTLFDENNNYKDYISNNKLTMYALWLEKAELCIAWDGYKAASGLEQNNIDVLKPKLETALKQKFGTVNGDQSITVNWRKYDDSDIVNKVSDINKHGDVDITFCFQDTINKPSYGKLEVVGLVTDFSFNGKIRTLGRLNNKETTLFAYNWFLDPKNLGFKERTSQHDLVVGWGWNGNGTDATNAIDYQTFNQYKAALETHLSNKGFPTNDIVYRAYRNSPANECGAAINADGDVDILIGFGSNLPTFGTEKTNGNVNIYAQKTATVNDNKRYFFQLNIGNDLVNEAFNWSVSSEATDALSRKEHKHIKIACDMRSTSGLTTTIVNNFSTALNNYITSQTLDYTFEISKYTTDTACHEILNDNCDIVVGMGSNFLSTYGVLFCKSFNCTINNKTGRRILTTVGHDEVTTIYNWMIGDGLTSLSGVKA